MSDDAPPSDPFAAKFGTVPQPAAKPSDTAATSAPAQNVSQNPGPATPDLSKMSMQELQSMVQPSQMPAQHDPTHTQSEQTQPAAMPQQQAPQFQQQTQVATQQLPQQQAQQFPQQQTQVAAQQQQFPQQQAQQFQQPNQAPVRPMDAATVNTTPPDPSYHGHVEPQITEFVMTQFRGSYAFGSAAVLLAPHGQRPATTREDIEQRINDANEAVRRIQREVAMLTHDLNAM